MAVEQLSGQLPVSEEAIRSGLVNVQLPGRFQLLKNGVQVLLDVGHNPEAVKTLVEYLAEYFPGKRIHAIFAMMKDKDISTVLKLMKPVVDEWFFVPLANVRAASEGLMRELFAVQAIENVHFGFSGFMDAYKAAHDRADSEDLLVVFGSFFLVSDCLAELEKIGKYNGS